MAVLCGGNTGDESGIDAACGKVAVDLGGDTPFVAHTHLIAAASAAPFHEYMKWEEIQVVYFAKNQSMPRMFSEIILYHC